MTNTTKHGTIACYHCDSAATDRLVYDTGYVAFVCKNHLKEAAKKVNLLGPM